MKELLPIKDLFAIEVPEDSQNHGVVHVYAGEDVLYWENAEGVRNGHNIDVNAYSVTVLFTTKDCIEEQAAGVVERQGGGWKDYDPDNKPPRYAFVAAVGSLKSLLLLNNLDPSTKNYLLIKRTNEHAT